LAAVAVERIEIPSPSSADAAQHFGLGEQPDFITAHVKRAAIDVAGRIGAKPYYQRCDMLWSAITGNVPAIPERVFAERTFERLSSPNCVGGAEISHRLR